MSGSSFGFDLMARLRGVEYLNLFHESGRVNKVLGPIVEGTIPGASVGGICRIVRSNGQVLDAEVVGFRNRTALLMPLGPVEGINMGARMDHVSSEALLNVGPWMIGRLLDGEGKIVEGLGEQAPPEIKSNEQEIRMIRGAALAPSARASISKRMELGVRALDSTIPLGYGQRIAVMAASGVGKSMLMGMVARQSKADLNVIALIGERGREVTEFIERDLGPEGMKKSIIVAVTGDQSPVLRVRGAYVATTIAEYFRDQGKNVLLMMDSVTRFGMALREIGLAAGEPPTTKGYTPSVFNQLPRLLERAGARRAGGSITGFYTVLVEGNDLDDPIADHVRSIVDGHVVLSRELAAKNHYPAIDVLSSVSRLITSISTSREQELNSEIRSSLAVYKEAEDLINIGAYRKGNNATWDRAIELNPKIISFLKQGPKEKAGIDDNAARLEEMFRG